MTRLTRADLINWADTKDAEGLLPELIRRLIIASNRSVDAIVMPYGDSIGRSGLDGFVHAKTASKYVPDGESVWECGRNTRHVRKANDDFKTRTERTAAVRQKELTYHCVTPRHWEKKAEWESAPGPTKEKIVGHWKAIRVLDVDDILGWLTDCPAVEAWFSRRLGKATAGVRDVEEYWQNVATTKAGVLSPKILLGGREELTKQVQAFLANEDEHCSPLAISSRSPAEVVPFAVTSAIESGNEVTISRTIVVDSHVRWEQLIVEESDLGLVVAPQVQPTREQLQQAVSRKHRVIYCSTTGDIELPRLTEFEVRQALLASGIGEAEATQHAKQCGGNGQLLLDRLSGLPAPVGSSGSRLDDRVKATCLLLVGWDGDYSSDREVFALLSGLRYNDIEASLVADSIDADGLLFRADGKFRLLSPEIAWIRYSSLITTSVVDRFADVVQYVFADDDPTAGMSGDERLTAQFLGRRPEFSGTLRRSIVHSLAIAGSIAGTRLNLDPSMSPSFVDWIVRATLKDASFHRWASFRDELSILAEASPEAVLDSLERDLHPDGPLAEVMDRTDTSLFSSPAHVGIVWALERLCWSPQYLERAICVLFRLTRLTAEINSGNNPVNSIRETLQLYCPQTNATWAHRQAAIARMLEEDAGGAFKIVLSLLPSRHSSWLCRELPTWRDWAYGYQSGATFGQIAIEVRWCVDQLLVAAGGDADRWCSLLDLFGKIDDEQYGEVLETFGAQLADGAFEDEGKRRLWEAMNAMLVDMERPSARHRMGNGSAPDANDIGYSESETETQCIAENPRCNTYGHRLRVLRDDSTPTDPVLAGCHAFLIGLYPNRCTRHFADRSDYRKQQEDISQARRGVAATVWLADGLNGLCRMAAIDHVDANGVGRAAASSEEVDIGVDEILPLLASKTISDRQFASGFVSAWALQRRDSLSTDVLPHLMTLTSDETTSSFLQCLPVVPDVWECVDEQRERVQQLYWRDAPLPWELPEGRLSYFVRNLNKVARADRSVELLTRCRQCISKDEVDLVFEAMEALPDVERAPDEAHNGSLRWELQELFGVLYEKGMSQVQRIVGLELLYHEVFEDEEGGKFQPRGLLMAMRDDPELYVELLRYPWEDDSGASTIPDDEPTRIFANRVRRLLHKLTELPGQSELCPPAGKSVAQWVGEVVQLASERRYLTAVGRHLPSVIASGAWNVSDSWPTNDIAAAINVLATAVPETFPQRLAVGVLNSRGVHSIDPTGQSERTQANAFRNRADELQQSCPAASRALRDVARSLDSDATRNVEQAKWRQ